MQLCACCCGVMNSDGNAAICSGDRPAAIVEPWILDTQIIKMPINIQTFDFDSLPQYTIYQLNRQPQTSTLIFSMHATIMNTQIKYRYSYYGSYMSHLPHVDRAEVVRKIIRIFENCDAHLWMNWNALKNTSHLLFDCLIFFTFFNKKIPIPHF